MPPKSPDKHPPVPEWFKQARFGMFLHWGPYSVLGHGEQPLFREFLNPSEYRKLADRFRAEKYDPSAWVETAKQANMKYMVLTAKHHDGFCLWDTETSDYNAARRGPGRDLIAEYVTAVRKAGLRVGLYFSLIEWVHRGFMAGPKRDAKAFRKFVRMTWTQIEELVSRYGRIDLLWFDGVSWPAARQWRAVELVRMIRRHQPNILINNRLPRPKGADWGYATPEQRLGAYTGQPWESCMTSTHRFWGYHVCHEDPSQWYSERELITMLTTCIANGGNMLLNVGPRADGELPEIFRERTRVIGDWIRRNRRAVYGTAPTDFEFRYGGVMARKGSRLYLFFNYWPGREYSLPGFNEKLRGARFLATGRPIRAVQEPHRILLKGMPAKAPDLCPVVELTFSGPPTAHPWAKNRLHDYPMPGMLDWLEL